MEHLSTNHAYTAGKPANALLVSTTTTDCAPPVIQGNTALLELIHALYVMIHVLQGNTKQVRVLQHKTGSVPIVLMDITVLQIHSLAHGVTHVQQG